jgi:hypothetical protein
VVHPVVLLDRATDWPSLPGIRLLNSSNQLTRLRYLQTGEALGIAGQTVAGLVSAGAAFPVFTGLSLSWRRFFGR